MTQRICLDCKRVFTLPRASESRCPRCKLRTTAERGYGTEYRKQREAVLMSATHCGICEKPFQPGEKRTAEHVYPLRLRKNRQGSVGKIVAAHEWCNYGWNKKDRKV